MADKFILASHTLTEHLLRGALGLGLVALALHLGPLHPVLALVLVVLSAVALRGCPTCWAVGLLHTAWSRLRGRPSPGAACKDGRCAKETLDTSRPRC